MTGGRHGVPETMLRELEAAFPGAVEKASESTVHVSTAAGPPVPSPWRFPRRGVGSGVVLDDAGHIVTSAHAVAGADAVFVTRSDGKILRGAVLGGDDDADIAVIHVEGSDFKPARFGDSDALKVGQPVLAIGNPLGLSGGPTVTSGVVSSLRRNLQLGTGNGLRMIQTDAAVNPGNSGGPLVDLDGRVVGINTATIPYAEGISFAVPSNVVREVAKQIIEHGRVQRPWLGVVGYDVNRRVAGYYGLAATRGVFVAEATPGGPAHAAGLEVGDVIVSIGKSDVGSVGDLVDALRSSKIADAVEVAVNRRGEIVRLRATLGVRPF